MPHAERLVACIYVLQDCPFGQRMHHVEPDLLGARDQRKTSVYGDRSADECSTIEESMNGVS